MCDALCQAFHVIYPLAYDTGVLTIPIYRREKQGTEKLNKQPRTTTTKMRK